MVLYLGEPANGYFAQTFVATGDHLQSLDLSMSSLGPGPTKYHLLITTVTTDQFHPGQVLKEVVGVADPVGGAVSSSVHMDLGGVALTKGQTYAFVLDAFVERDGVQDLALMGLSPDNPDVDWYYYQPSGGTRSDHFAATWTHYGLDMSVSMLLTTAGNTIVGNGKANLIDATHAPGGQPLPTAFDDVLLGNGGKDRLFAGDGYDTLIGGKGHDQLFGGTGGDSYVFDFKMTKKSAHKNFDKIGDFNVAEDTIKLDQKHFTALALGEVPDTDTHITLVVNKLLYDGVKFAKFLPGVAPASVDDIHFDVYA